MVRYAKNKQLSNFFALGNRKVVLTSKWFLMKKLKGLGTLGINTP